MMKTFLQPLMLLALGFLVRFADIAMSAAMSRNVIRAVCYGIVALFALLIVVFALFSL